MCILLFEDLSLAQQQSTEPPPQKRRIGDVSGDGS